MTSINPTTARTQALQDTLSASEALLLCQPEDIRYYSGFDCLVSSEREAFLVVTAIKAHLLYASFSPTITVFDGIILRKGVFLSQVAQHLQEIQAQEPFETLYCDFDHLLHAEYLQLNKTASCTLAPLERSSITKQRSIKDSTERKYIAKATTITSQVLEWIPTQFIEGITEAELTNRIYKKMLDLGADITPAFPAIVAFGPHSALPHHQPTDANLTPNMAVLIDIGARYHSYCSDMTRTFWFGDTPDPEFASIEKTVAAAYKAASQQLQKLENGITAQSIDEAARSTITAAGYGNQFIHTTGHGLGLEIHEQPSLSWKNEQQLQKYMVITIEPGIYLTGKFGYRFENTLILE